jgi:hypothetical protein
MVYDSKHSAAGYAAVGELRTGFQLFTSVTLTSPHETPAAGFFLDRCVDVPSQCGHEEKWTGQLPNYNLGRCLRPKSSGRLKQAASRHAVVTANGESAISPRRQMVRPCSLGFRRSSRKNSRNVPTHDGSAGISNAATANFTLNAGLAVRSAKSETQANSCFQRIEGGVFTTPTILAIDERKP